MSLHALSSSPQYALVAWVMCLCRLANSPHLDFIHSILVARVGACLLRCFRVDVALVVQECLKLIASGGVGETFVPLRMLVDELVLGLEDVLIASLPRQRRMATRDVFADAGLIHEVTRLWADIFFLQIVLDILERGGRTEPGIPSWILDGLFLGVQHMAVALVTRNRSVAIFLRLLCLALCTCCPCSVPWMRARPGTAPLPTVQHLGVHEGLEVGKSGAIVQADVPFRMKVPVSHGIHNICVAALSSFRSVAILLDNRQLYCNPGSKPLAVGRRPAP
mmetsp:Transcript_3738/g.10322  ORF Transcript_3738/g.10322 Transcript_3738/m.10322 type:complete len:278 (-) Transcript_3738:262-1095(-)